MIFTTNTKKTNKDVVHKLPQDEIDYINEMVDEAEVYKK